MNTDYTVEDCFLFNITTFTDERGQISVMDKELPFEVKRVFWLHHIAEGKSRGSHALLDGSEIMVAINGSFMVDLYDGEMNISILLDDLSKGLLIRPGIWFTVHDYKYDGVSLILASEEYCREYYTCDLEEYKKLRRV